MSMRTKNPQRSPAARILPQVVDADGPIDVEAELGELEREVALDPGAIDGLDQIEILARRRLGRGQGRDALAQIVERVEQPLGLDAPDRRDRILDGLAGDEPPRERLRARHPVAGRQRLQCAAAGEGLKEGLGRDIQHQCVRPDPDVSRCSIVRA